MNSAMKVSDKLPTDEDRALAAKVMEFMEGLIDDPQTEKSDYLWNLSIYGKAGMVTAKGLGIVASAVVAYNRAQADKVQRAAIVSKHIGAIKDKLHLRVKLLAIHASNGYYGPSYIHKMQVLDGEHAGAMLTWFGSHKLRQYGDDTQNVEIGSEFWVAGSVKAHNEYKGLKETVLTRADAVGSPEQIAEAVAAAKAAKKVEGAAKRKAAKETEAARKAFGPPALCAEYVKADYARYADTDKPLSERQVYSRVLQTAATEYTVERQVHVGGVFNGTWEVVERYTDLDEAERTAMAQSTALTHR